MAKIEIVALYKLGQIIGAGATLFISLWLFSHPTFEPNATIRWAEIILSVVAALMLGADALDLNPTED